MMNSPALELHDLTVSYAKKPVLYGVDVQVPQGALVGIIGPNGAGKSTMIRAIMGLTPASSGWVQIFGESFEKNRHRVGYVPQLERVDCCLVIHTAAGNDSTQWTQVRRRVCV